jgi:hypothetical protein
VKRLLIAVSIALVLFAIARHDRDQEPVPPPAPAVVAAPTAPLAVPLAISETTPPPGWVNPSDMTSEQRLGAWLADMGLVVRGGIVGIIAMLSIIAALVVSAEKSRAQ